MRARSHRLVFVVLLASLVASLVMLVGCKKGSSSSSAPAFTSLGASTAALRDAFNHDVGRARVLMLVSPT